MKSNRPPPSDAVPNREVKVSGAQEFGPQGGTRSGSETAEKKKDGEGAMSESAVDPSESLRAPLLYLYLPPLHGAL